ncbi:hypothetical protein MRX96_007667 [Rhipicephalus microplus]
MRTPGETTISVEVVEVGEEVVLELLYQIQNHQTADSEYHNTNYKVNYDKANTQFNNPQANDHDTADYKAKNYYDTTNYRTVDNHINYSHAHNYHPVDDKANDYYDTTNFHTVDNHTNYSHAHDYPTVYDKANDYYDTTNYYTVNNHTNYSHTHYYHTVDKANNYYDMAHNHTLDNYYANDYNTANCGHNRIAEITVVLETRSRTRPDEGLRPVDQRRLKRPHVCPPYTFVCTVTEPVRSTARGATSFVPPDGTCDYVFYDSLYKNGKNNLLNGLDKLEIVVQHFIGLASRFKQSKFGFSFAPEPVFQREFKDPLFLAYIDAIYGTYNISHYGFLDLYKQYAEHAMVTEALNALKVLYLHLKPKNTATRTSYYVIGLSLDNPASGQILNLMKTVFAPSMFIAISHLSYPVRKLSDCRIFPVAMDTLPPNLVRGKDYTYGHTVVRTHSNY